MKNKIYFLAILVFGLGFLGSCSSDDDNGAGSHADQIVGKWSFVESGFVVNGMEVLEPWDHECATKNDHVEFTGAGKLYDHYYGSDCVVETEISNYSIDGNTIIVLQDGEAETATIEVLNSTTLKLKVQEAYGGTDFTYVTVLKRM